MLMKDIKLDNIRYSPLKKSSSKNKYSYISYLNDDDEIQNIVFQCNQMKIYDFSKNEKGLYSITFEVSDYMYNFIESIDNKIKTDIKELVENKKAKYMYRPSVNITYDLDVKYSDEYFKKHVLNTSETQVDSEHQYDHFERLRSKDPSSNSHVSLSEDNNFEGKHTSPSSKSHALSENDLQTTHNLVDLETKKELKVENQEVVDKKKLLKCKVGNITNLIVFDQYKKLYDDEQNILKLLDSQKYAIPIIECLGVWITENEIGLTWVCHNIKVISSITKKYFFVEENNKILSDDSDTFQSFSMRNWETKLPKKIFEKVESDNTEKNIQFLTN